VSTDVPVADIGEVAAGQEADVTPDSTTSLIKGKVTSIGILATSGTTTTYPVTIGIQSPDLGQLSGVEAGVSIVTKRAVGATTVPTSAVRTVGSNHIVTVVEGSTLKATRVTVGVLGDVLTQVTSGVTSGQRVSLADLNEPVPTTSTASTRGFSRAGLGGTGFGASGGFGGGGGFGGRG
jgi:HlyD family secretion protein